MYIVWLMHGSQVLVGPETLASLGFIDRSIVIAVRQVKGRFLNVEGHRDVLELWAGINAWDERDCWGTTRQNSHCPRALLGKSRQV